MTSAESTVTLRFIGKGDELQKTIDKQSASVKRMGDDVDTSSKKMSKSTEESTGKMKEHFGGLGTMVGAAIGGLAIGGAKHFFDLSKSMEALDVKSKTIFEGQLPDMQKWAEQNRKSFGESSRNVVAMAAGLADLLKPMGFTSAEAAKMSKEMLDLAGALSRWSGGTKSAAEVSDIMVSAMLGETDGLKALGISLSAAEVEAKALSMGLVKSNVDMTKVKDATLSLEQAQRAAGDAVKQHGQKSDEARKAQINLEKAQQGLEAATKGAKGEITDQARALATQKLIMEKSTDAQKAWANGGKAAAEAQNTLKSNMAETSEKLATVVAPAFEKMVSLLSAVADWISKNQTAALVIAGLVVAVWALNAALAANPIVLVAIAIAALVAGIIILWNKSEGFRMYFMSMWNLIVDIVSGAARGIEAAWDGVVWFFTELPQKIGRALGGLASGIGDAFKGALNIVINYLNWWVDRVNNIISGINAVNPFSSIPSIPHIGRLHTGGVVGGTPGSEQLRILQAGETVSPRDEPLSRSGGGASLEVTGDATAWLYQMIKYGIRTGAIKLKAS